MEKNLLVGDFLLVSKLSYGPRTPITLGIPFTNIHLKSLELPFGRLPGFGEVERGEAFVFNYPPEEAAIDRKTHYIKRAMGLPGDTLSLIDKVVHINGEPIPLMSSMQQEWMVYKTTPEVQLPMSRLRELGVEAALATGRPGQVLLRYGTPEAAAEIESWPYVDRVEPFVLPNHAADNGMIFPKGSSFNRDNYGPLVIPRSGQTVHLTDQTWPMYEELITRYEKHEARRTGTNTFEIDGQTVTSYTIEQDYYFAMGDNRDNSLDSRAWGFVPGDHVVGKAFLIYFSWDAESGPRFSRLFNLIK
jgi:signal peptidase I